MKDLFPEEVFQAAREYLWLLSRGYPQKSSLKLVGDKFMLTRDMRQVLYRGISSGEKAEARKERLGSVLKGELVLIDTYNVLFTVNNYLLGRPLFISNDGMLRDAGEMRGRIVNKPVFSRAVGLMLEILREWPAASYIHYLDEPIPFSGRLSIELSKDMVQMGIEGEALTVKSPDQMLMNQKCDAICTSDTAIIDHCLCKVVDLPSFLLKKYFQTEFSSFSL
jgi:hypothetical protein